MIYSNFKEYCVRLDLTARKGDVLLSLQLHLNLTILVLFETGEENLQPYLAQTHILKGKFTFFCREKLNANNL